jgi:hypothetical protein
MTARVTARGVAASGAVALALGNLGRIPGGMLGGRTAPVVALDLVVGVVWLLLAIAVASRRTRIVFDGVTGAATLFVGVAFVSTILALPRYGLSTVEGAGVVAFLIRWLAYFGWYPFIAWCLTPAESRDAWRYVERALLVFCVFGLIQSMFFPGFAQMVNAGGDMKSWDVQGRRLVSTLLDPNFAGIVIAIALLFRLARVAEGEREGGWAMSALAAGLLLTVSRSSILALLVGIIVIAAVRGLRLPLLRVFAAGSLILLPFLSFLVAFAAGFHKLGVDMSAAQRLVPWTRAVRLVSEHPLLGIGFNATQQAQEAHGWNPVGGADISLDGGLLFVAAMTGIIGAGLYVLMMTSVVKNARRAWRDPETPAADRAHALATAASTVAVVVHSLFVNSLLLPFVMQILWVMWGRLAHVTAARRARAGLPRARTLVLGALATTVTVVMMGCDPCAGTPQCSTSPRYRVTGVIVDHLTGRGVAGVHVDASFPAASGSVTGSAVTADDGTWTLEAAAASASGDATFTILAPGKWAYTTPPVTVHAVTARGAADVVGQWTDVPYVHYQATLYRRGQPLGGASVQFIPVDPSSVVLESAVSGSNDAGVFNLDLAGKTLTGIVGTLLVSHPAMVQTAHLTNYYIGVDYRYHIPQPQAAVTVGGQIAYGGETLFRGTGEKVGNVGVTFRRTGGIPVTPEAVSTTSNATGFFRIDMTPLGDGDVIGDLTLTPPTGAAAVYHNVHLATYDSLAIRSMGVWAFGERWAWTIELWRFDSLKPAPNVGVIYRRTGGLNIEPAVFENIHTDAGGRFELRATVRDTGTVLGEIVVFPSAGPPRVIPNVRLRTNADDQLHFAGVFGFGPALRYVGEVLTTDGAPVAGAQVTWTQTAGVPATPNPLNTTTGADGRFPLQLYPSLDGEVTGTVRVRPPAPWPAGTEFVFTNLKLNSFESADLKLAVTYRIPRP